MTARELTINGVHWTVEYVRPGDEAHGDGAGGGLQYTSENGFRCFVRFAAVGLPADPEAFATVSDDLLAAWAQTALRRRHERHQPPSAA